MFFIPLPQFSFTQKITNWLQGQPRDRAQFLLRILAGINLAYLGIDYKFFHPNLAIGALTIGKAWTFGISVSTFVFLMAIIETFAGFLLLFGSLIRPMSLILLVCFIFLTYVLGENPIGHIIIYGVLIVCYINGAGQWRIRLAKDKAANIVIIGASFAGIHAVLKIEKLIGIVSNINVTLINDENYFQFDPLLPEVIGGSVQPSNIVNPIRRICSRAAFIQGKTKSIDYANKTVTITLLSDEEINITYDELILSPAREINFANIPGMLEHAMPIMNIGDALLLRQRILESLELAINAHDAEEKKKLLTFGIIGGGIRGASVAEEVNSFFKAAIVSYPMLSLNECTVYLIEKSDEILPECESILQKTAHKQLSKMGIIVLTHANVTQVTSNAIMLETGDKVFCHTTICALTQISSLVADLPKNNRGFLLTNEYFEVANKHSLFAVGDVTDVSHQVYFQATLEARMGRNAGYNAWAKSQNFKMKEYDPRRPLFGVLSLGRHASEVKIFGVVFTGVIAWFISRWVCLITLPGLERNLRILIDWLLDVPFRQDIVNISPKLTTKLNRAHYDAGDEIVHEGEAGENAFLILKGEVAVLKNENGSMKQLAILKPGELFGEIALLKNMRRTATVKAITPVDVIVLAKDQFLPLLSGFQELDSLVKKRLQERLR